MVQKKRRKATGRQMKYRKPVILPHRFRSKSPPEVGKCDSIYCHCPSNGDAWLVHCVKCRNAIHLDCLGIENQQQLPNRFSCSGCRSNDKSKLTRPRYILLTRKLRRYYRYIKKIASGFFGSWRMRDYLKGGAARRNLWSSSSLSFTSEEELDNMLELFIGWVNDWKLFQYRCDAIKFSLDVLLPEALIRTIMEVENVHRDHAEYLFLRSRLE